MSSISGRHGKEDYGIPLTPLKKKSGKEIREKIPKAGIRHAEKTAAFANETVKNIKDVVSSPLQGVKPVLYINAEVLKEKLEPGDIVLSYYPNNSNGVEFLDAVALALRTGQTLTKLYTKNTADLSENFIHAALYVGDGQFSEAVKEGIRLNSIEGERFKLGTGETRAFLVVRLKNPEIAKEASRIAKELAVEGEEETNYKYSIGRALFSGMVSTDLNEEAMKRYVKGAAYAINKILPMDRNGIRDFFCSYFVAWACQAGESIEVMKTINEQLSEDDKIVFPDLSHVSTDSERGVVLNNWAGEVVRQHYDLLREHVKINLDPKFTTPQDLYVFCLRRKELFEQKMIIMAPPKEIEMQTISNSKKE